MTYVIFQYCLSTFIYIWNGYRINDDLRYKRTGWMWTRIIFMVFCFLSDLVMFSKLH